MDRDRGTPGGGAAGRWAAVLLLTALVAAAFFLPEWFSGLRDRQILDHPVVETRDGEPEGFAETIGLTVAEKLALLRSGSLTVMELSQEMEAGFSLNVSNGYDGMAVVELVPPAAPENGGGTEVEFFSEEAELRAYGEEISQVWKDRLTAARTEIRNLQALGGLPSLWSEGSELDCVDLSELLYLDPGTQMSFQVYRMTLMHDPYSLTLSMDAQSGRILSFHLQWVWGDRRPQWGLQGSANFGTAWRNYWGMDSVGGGWYNSYNRGILEPQSVGDYDAHGQISFTYNGQTVLIPLDGWYYKGRSSALAWNI